MKDYELIIIGGGPAGLTAALYASRAGVSTLVLERGMAGGKVFTTHLVENYPGIEKISGRDLAIQLKESCLQFGAEFKNENVSTVEKQDEDFIVTTSSGKYTSKNVILATGTDNKKLGVPGEEELLGRGVSYCAICDGNFFRNKDVAVIGGGNSALEEALYLADICNSVTIVHRRDEFRAENYIQEKVKAKDNIKFELSSNLSSIDGDGKVESINIITNDKVEKKLDVSAVFIYVGLKANTIEFSNFDIFDSNNNIVVDGNMKTKVEGLYGAGDVNQKKLRQIATAVNDGALAAQSVIEKLK